MSRALLNNNEVIEFVKSNFIPVSAAIEQLQPGRYGARESEQSKWFLPMAQKAMREFGPPGFWKEFKTYQGLYVVGADGTPYQYKVGVNYDPKYFVNVLKGALAKYQSSPRQNISLSRPAIDPSFQIDPSISVVQVYSRVVPLPVGATISERSVGRDYMWIMKDEVDKLIDASKNQTTDIKLPATMVARMVRFQLLNHVGNIMRPFGETQVKKAEFKAKKLSETGDLLSIAFEGQYSSYAPKGADDGGEGSVDGTITGELQVNKTEKKICRFRAYGEAQCQGRNDTLKNKKYPIVFAMKEAKDLTSQTVIPFWAAIPSLAPIYAKPKISSK